jgi:hypothetical protein
MSVVVGITRARRCVCRVASLSCRMEKYTWENQRVITREKGRDSLPLRNAFSRNDSVKLPHSLTTPGRSSRAPLKGERTSERAIDFVVSSFAVVFGQSVGRLRVKGRERDSTFEPFVEKCHRKRGREVGQTRRRRRRRRRRNRNPTETVVDLILLNNRARRRNVKGRGREEEETTTVNMKRTPTAVQRRSEAE